MRDAHRMKEKYDVSLDNRQIAGMLVGGIVVLGAVFVLGVVVGKGLAVGTPDSTNTDVLGALDARQQALTAAQEETEAALTFHEELTKKVAQTAPPPEEARPAEAAKAPEVAPAPKPVPAAEAKPPRESPLQQAIAKATEKTEKRTATPPPSGPGDFTLQLSAFQSREDADRFASKLRGRGYAPYIVAAQVPGKGAWYRVRMGSFPSREGAQNYLADFKRETQLQAYVTAKE